MTTIRAGKKKGKGPVAPVTAQDHLESGVTEEDHGDRWIGSGDAAKALRFYQTANSLYRKAIALDQGQSWVSKDSIYNIARMQYMIFIKVVKPGLLPELAPLLNPETNPAESVIAQDISVIVQTHEQALNASAEPGIDLLYNYAQVLVEAGEETDQAQWFVQAAEVFDRVLSLQIAKFTAPLPTYDDSVATQDVDSDDDDEDSNDSRPTPAVILDTQQSFLQCLTYLIESSRDETTPETVLIHVETAKSKADELQAQILELIAKFSTAPGAPIATAPTTSETSQNLTPDQVEDAVVCIAKYKSALCTSLEELVAVWSDPSLPETAHRYLTQADAYLDTQELIPSSTPQEDAHNTLWKAYSLAASLLAKAPQPANTPILTKRRILLVRGDIDWLRAQLNTAAAIKNRPVLLRNAEVYYQNCINVPSLAQDLDNELIVREASVKKQLLQGIQPESIQVPSLTRILHDIRQQGLLPL
ncbi:Uncharacterized protein YNL193W [Sugiyamaella lignohabitans]|uniref:Uncharacterized protein YNL193W n=1 Tax=Sugiyamaella lignohabitans TaxID=796027 RepID=A0A167EP81_9ASCO|nr:Uncharacterized protein YNL193W [Sugiyamaella lignohabitans]ANB14308.1 Uncharacterized protein YNL193W [Sugiyamaella lignohabitans]